VIAIWTAIVLASAPSTETHPNGAQLVVLERPSHPRAHLRVALRAGALTDPAGRSGLAAVSNHAAAGEMERRLERFGVHVRAAVGSESMAFSAECARSDAPIVLREMLEVLRTATVSEARFAEAIRAAVRDRDAITANPTALGLEAARRLAFRDHPAARPIGGRRAELETIERSHVHEWLRAHAVGASTIVGALASDVASLQPDLRAASSRLRSGATVPLTLAPPPVSDGVRVMIVDYPSIRTDLIFIAQSGLRTPNHGAGARAAAIAALTLSTTADWTAPIRDAGATVVGLHAQPVAGTSFELLTIGFAVSKQIAPTVGAALDALERVGRDGLGSADAARGRARADTELRTHSSSGEGRLQAELGAQLAGRQSADPEALMLALARTSTGAVSSVVRDAVRWDRAQVVVVANASNRLFAALGRIDGVSAVQVVRFDSLP